MGFWTSRRASVSQSVSLVEVLQNTEPTDKQKCYSDGFGVTVSARSGLLNVSQFSHLPKQRGRRRLSERKLWR